MILEKTEINKIATLLIEGKIGILPTDTIYGIHCLALDNALIDKVYKIKKRPKTLPYITLISNESQLDLFELELKEFEKEAIKKYWPGRNTLVFKKSNGETKSFRLPDDKFLTELINLTGPLISTSANISGNDFVTNIKQAQEIFKEEIDFYVDGGELKNKASNVYSLLNNKVEKIR